ncbi:UPF0716 protein FxsA [Bisgaardia hudsonensis]|uniref:UPF0716 protein FxsA n=1 Tax=Bisgaardia hudsonensis TaxID=109472 RepID=A0A4R2N152_9PAST|nr:FxsA family protein [Bisgaardia hudsonensis]QLB13136.1 hypothetical protein A6A11_05670 [Bisgaardia hudsonensis]TCP13292.1 UPF0716 protein FxsA [Bisgaardia hudsonensis]
MYRIIFFISLFLYFYCEISLIIMIGSTIGAFGVIVSMIIISIVGIWLIRLQGAMTAFNIQKQIQVGTFTVKELTAPIIMLIAGILFLIPGFLSDILAVLLIVPFTRKILQNLVLDLLFSKFISANYRQQSNRSDDTILDVEFERSDDKQDK